MSERIKLLGLQIRNLYGIRAADLELDPEQGRLVEITGPNRAGKTSVVRSFLGLVYGAGAVSEHALNDQVEEGEDGWAKGTFSNGWRITRTVSPKHPKGVLRIEKDTGAKGKQADLDAWVVNKGADILVPRRMRISDLTEELLSVGKDPELPRKLKEVRTRRAALEADRSPHVSEKQRAERTRKPEGDRPPAVDVKEAMEELAGLEACQAEKDDLKKTLDEAMGTVKSLQDLAQQKAKKIVEVQAQLDAAKRAYDAAEARLEAAKRAEAQAEFAWDDQPDLTDQIVAKKEEIGQADEKNLALKPWIDWDEAGRTIEREAEEIRTLNHQIKDTRTEEAHFLEEAQIPITGLSFSENFEPLLHGRPLDLASGREWMLFSFELAMAKDQELGVLVMDETNDVDQEGMALLLDLLEEHDLQALVCRILPSGVGEVVACDDGQAFLLGGASND